MLDILHNKINNIVQIRGILEINGTYQIDYVATPTPEQELVIEEILAQWPLESAKAQKYHELDQEWKILIANGWITPEGWKLGLQNQDVTLLTGAFVLAKEASNLGIDAPTVIVDMDGQPHSLSFSELTSLMLGYGQARAALSQEYSSKRELISSAASLEELGMSTTTTTTTTTTVEPTTTTTVEPDNNDI